MDIEEKKNEMRRRTKGFAGRVIQVYLALDKRREELRILGKRHC